MEKPQYYSITVKKMNILTRHSDWLVKTQELYNQILEFYYNLYLDTFQDGRPGSMEALRTLEKLTIPGRDRQPVQYPLPWQKFLCISGELQLTVPLLRLTVTFPEKNRRSVPLLSQNPLPVIKACIVILKEMRSH